jgi:hypothetical protein
VMGFASLYPSYDRHTFAFSRRNADDLLYKLSEIFLQKGLDGF